MTAIKFYSLALAVLSTQYLILDKHKLAKSNEYYNRIHPTEAAEIDEARAAAVEKAKAAAAAKAAKAKEAAAKKESSAG